MKGRAQQEHEAQPQQPQTLTALLDEKYLPAIVNLVEPGPGEPPLIGLQQLIGQLNPTTFVAAKTAQLSPDTAVALGEALAAAGRKVRSGLSVHTAVDLANIDKSKLGQTG